MDQSKRGKTCPQCGKWFTDKPSHLAKRIFCSVACRNAGPPVKHWAEGTDLTIPVGLCQCGCGGKTSVYTHTVRREGYEKGVPRRYLPGHNNEKGRRGPKGPGRAVRRSGYVVVYAPNHPRAMKGYVYEHILVAEKALGRYLPEGAEVHHVNLDKADNRGCNLVIVPDHSYHMSLHNRQRALEREAR